MNTGKTWIMVSHAQKWTQNQEGKMTTERRIDIEITSSVISLRHLAYCMET